MFVHAGREGVELYLVLHVIIIIYEVIDTWFLNVDMTHSLQSPLVDTFELRRYVGWLKS